MITINKQNSNTFARVFGSSATGYQASIVQRVKAYGGICEEDFQYGKGFKTEAGAVKWANKQLA